MVDREALSVLLIALNPDVVACVQETLSSSDIAVVHTAGADCDCVLANIDFAGLPALLHGASPVVVLSDRPTSPGICADMVLAGAQDCLTTSQLSDGRLEHVIRSAIHRHAASAAELQTRHAAEALLAAVVTASHDPIWSVLIGGEVSSWNSGAEALLGYSAEEIVGRNIRVLAASDCVAEIDDFGRRLRAGQVSGPSVTERIAKDGSVKHVSVTVSPILDDGGSPIGGCVVARDLGPQQASESELVASEERYRRIVETAGEGIVVIGEDAVITFVNQRFAEMLGYARSDLVGVSAFDLIHPDDVAPSRERWRSPSLPTSRVEVRYRRSDGAVVWALVSRTRQSGSTDASWLVMVTDITDRKLAEQDLAEREQRFRAVFDSAYDAILIVDDDRRFIDVNPAACRIYGRTREQMLALRIEDVSDYGANSGPPDSWDTFREGAIRTGSMTVVRPDGEVREIEYASTPNINPHRHLSIARDVTDRNASAAEGMALEHRLNQAERLETVGQLAGGVAHDFNNILSIIVNYAELARTARDSGSVHEDLAEISAAAARGRALTRQLLIVSRRDLARPEVFDLAGLISSVHSLLQRVIGDRILIEAELPAGPIAVSADRGRIDQLVMNLALNARDAMPAGGTLSLTVRRRTASGAGSIGDVELTVADNGVGMIDVVAARAFEPFYTTKSEGQGVGLGLAAAHGIVADAGGQISLESRLGEGTTVTVAFPGVSEDLLGPVAKPAPEALDGGGRHILIVEDDAKLRETTRRVLDRHGYVTSTASNAEDALAAVDGSEVETVLTDLVMPGLSGHGLAQRLRARRPDIHLVCMSGYSPRRGMLPDDVTILEKPFTPQELLGAVAKAGASV